MKDFIKRMLKEKQDLQVKIDKAKMALDNTTLLDVEEKNMLNEQLIGMEKYLYWLSKRLSYEVGK